MERNKQQTEKQHIKTQQTFYLRHIRKHNQIRAERIRSPQCDKQQLKIKRMPMKNRTKINQLADLYRTVHALNDLGFQIPLELSNTKKCLEYEIIQDEIAPILTSSLEPLLGKMQQELTLTIKYAPDKPLRVSMSDKRTKLLSADELEEKRQREAESRTYHVRFFAPDTPLKSTK